MKFEYLSDHQHYIPTLVDWFHDEWGHLNPGRKKDDIVKKIQTHLNKNQLPIIFIGIEKNELCGTVSLRKFEMEGFEHFYPWLSSLYVPIEKRKKGIGKILVENCIEKAKKLGASELYLFTENHEEWYKKLGWQCIQKVTHRNYPATIMKITL